MATCYLRRNSDDRHKLFLEFKIYAVYINREPNHVAKIDIDYLYQFKFQKNKKTEYDRREKRLKNKFLKVIKIKGG